jgi:hypothetical protein
MPLRICDLSPTHNDNKMARFFSSASATSARAMITRSVFRLVLLAAVVIAVSAKDPDRIGPRRILASAGTRGNTEPNVTEPGAWGPGWLLGFFGLEDGDIFGFRWLLHMWQMLTLTPTP